MSKEEFLKAHQFADTDAERYSLHHTLGLSPNQASPGNHDHDDTYANIDHTHDAAYAALGHLHDDRYSLLSHLHDDRYSLLAHNHDAAYAGIAHKHAPEIWRKGCTPSTAFPVGATFGDVPNCTIDVPVLSTNDIFRITMEADITSQGTSGIAIVALDYNNGTRPNPQINWQISAASQRAALSKVIPDLTNVPVGTINFKLIYRCTGGSYTIQGIHTQITVERIYRG